MAAKTSYTDVDSYGLVSASVLSSIEPAVTYQAAVSTGPTVVSFEIANNGASTPQEVGLAALANSGTCYLLRDVANVGGTHPSGTSFDRRTLRPTAPAHSHGTTPRRLVGRCPGGRDHRGVGTRTR